MPVTITTNPPHVLSDCPLSVSVQLLIGKPFPEQLSRWAIYIYKGMPITTTTATTTTTTNPLHVLPYSSSQSGTKPAAVPASSEQVGREFPRNVVPALWRRFRSSHTHKEHLVFPLGARLESGFRWCLGRISTYPLRDFTQIPTSLDNLLTLGSERVLPLTPLTPKDQRRQLTTLKMENKH